MGVAVVVKGGRWWRTRVESEEREGRVGRGDA